MALENIQNHASGEGASKARYHAPIEHASTTLHVFNRQFGDAAYRGERAAESAFRTPDAFVASAVAGEVLVLILLGAGLSPIAWGRAGGEMLLPYGAAILLISAAFASLVSARGGYRHIAWLYPGEHWPKLVEAWASVWVGALTLAFLFKVSHDFSRLWAVSWFSVGGIGVGALHFALSRLFKRTVSAGGIAQRVAVYGAGSPGETVLQALQTGEDPLLRIEGVYDDRKTRIPALVNGRKVAGGSRQLIEDILERRIDVVLIALPMAAEARLREIERILEQVAVEVRLVPPPSWYSLGRKSVRQVGSIPTLGLWEPPFRKSEAILKWLLDKTVAGTAVVVLSPLLALIAAAIRLESQGPVLFRQRRFGFNNEAIEVLKFRTMYIDRQDVTGTERTIKDDPRITRPGRILRRLSLDELPQLFNVLKGEMSLVGPRPHAIAMKVGDQYYFEAVRGYAARHRVKPGITGWAQVNGSRGEVDTFERAQRRVQLDLEYLNDWSLAMDIRIIIKTIFVVIRQTSAY